MKLEFSDGRFIVLTFEGDFSQFAKEQIFLVVKAFGNQVLRLSGDSALEFSGHEEAVLSKEGEGHAQV